MEKLIKAVLRRNPCRHRQEPLEYGMTPGHLTTHTVWTRRLPEQSGLAMVPCQDNCSRQKDLNAMDVEECRSVDLLSNVISVRNLGT